MGGGAGSYTGFKIPEKLKKNDNAAFEAEVVDKDHIRFKATSTKGFGTVGETIDQTGRTATGHTGDSFSDRCAAIMR